MTRTDTSTTSSFTIAQDGTPTYRPASRLASSLCDAAATVALADGWEAEDGEEMTVLILRTANAALVGALPAPAGDEAWLAAFTAADTMTVNGRTGPRSLDVVT